MEHLHQRLYGVDASGSI